MKVKQGKENNSEAEKYEVLHIGAFLVCDLEM